MNAALNAVRLRERRREIEERLRRDGREALEAPMDPLVADEETRRVREALSRLDPADRALLSLRYDEELTFREIAGALRRPASTIAPRRPRPGRLPGPPRGPRG
ncbi:MAG: sigma-70 family RNA polymerase sigma factor [Planctomycetes bacterium]|nr:sigma-70 family RNA polymerase sigma factor [Planctomycetota bacterium]